MNLNTSKNLKLIAGIIIAAFLLIMLWGIFMPHSRQSSKEIVYVVQKGMGYKEIGIALEKQGIISSHGFFSAYALISLSYNNLQAGSYTVSPSMSVADIIKKLATGNVIKNNVTIIEGWNLEDIGLYFESKNIVSKKDFLDLTKKDFSKEYDFLQDLPAQAGKPKKLNLEGYVFPDTYEFGKSQTTEDFLHNALDNFDKKLTPELRKEVTRQKKSIFQIITMASMLEKEVKTPEDKKIVSGILWKRIAGGMPLQIDATINYITKKNSKGVAIKDTKIDSPYNTYKYYGLPLGPICNPGMDSILAAIYPQKSDYWYYLSADESGATIFSKTLEEHNAAVVRYLK